MLTKIFQFAAVSVAIYFAIAGALILSQRPTELPEREGLDFARILGSGAPPPQDPAFARKRFTARDGTELGYTHVATEGAEARPLIIMLHGSGWYGGQFDRLAWALRDVAEVKALTLRGHGPSPKQRGDVGYIGQFEDDIADLIGEESRPVVLLGHSSGGGLAMRFAGGDHGHLINGAILLAPFVHHSAPTMRENSGGWAHVLLRRVIGLSMLNAARIHALDGLTAIQFNMPKAALEGPLGHMATTSYSWRLNTSYAPRSDYKADIAALPRFLLLAGAQDEAFRAEEYEPLMASVTDKGRYVLIEGVKHLDVVDHAETERRIREFLSEF